MQGTGRQHFLFTHCPVLSVSLRACTSRACGFYGRLVGTCFSIFAKCVIICQKTQYTDVIQMHIDSYEVNENLMGCVV